MNENKEIEEMARKICMCYIEGNCTVDKKPCNCDCANYLFAEKFYRVGYRNVKDKVVIDKHKYILANKCYSDATLKGWKKEDLIEQIRILEDNWAGAEERITNQGNYIESLLKQIEFWECDAQTYKIWKDKLVEELAKASELKAETIKLAKTETAREIIKALKNMAYQSNDWSYGTHPMVVEVDEIEELAEKYGVEYQEDFD